MAGGRKCSFPFCEQPAKLYYMLWQSSQKVWMCVKHHDQMAEHYKVAAMTTEREHPKKMVKKNGW